jgi:hypothetical protein
MIPFVMDLILPIPTRVRILSREENSGGLYHRVQ